jgi:hypothetical protein
LEAVRFFARAATELGEASAAKTCIGLAGGWFALTVGNYYLAALSRREFLVAAFSGAAGPLPERYTFESAIAPVVLAGAAIERLGWAVDDDDCWRTFAPACEALFISRQGGSNRYLTSRAREPLPNVLQPAATMAAQVERALGRA